MNFHCPHIDQCNSGHACTLRQNRELGAQTSYDASRKRVELGIGKLGDVMRLQRRARKLKQCELAERLGITNSYYSDIERGSRRLPARLVRPVSELLGISERDMIYSLHEEAVRAEEARARPVRRDDEGEDE